MDQAIKKSPRPFTGSWGHYVSKPFQSMHNLKHFQLLVKGYFPPGLWGGCVRRLPARIDEMKGRKHRVAPEHPGAGVAHGGADLLPHVRVVAMDGAVGAGGLPFTERTFDQPPAGIAQKLSAAETNFASHAVMPPAVKPDHRLDGPVFPCDPGVGFCHGDNIRRPAPDGKGFPDRGRPQRVQNRITSACSSRCSRWSSVPRGT